MSLDDVCRLVCPRRPEQARKILSAFYMKPRVSKEEILNETGMGAKLFGYYLTRFRKFRIIGGERTPEGYRYYISVGEAHGRLDAMFIDPLRTLGR